ncbi:hypothetical protein P9112_002260 [Eukaryota sp. TZLM1-RC]
MSHISKKIEEKFKKPDEKRLHAVSSCDQCIELPSETAVATVETSDSATEEQQMYYEPILRSKLTHQNYDRITRIDEPITEEESALKAEVKISEPIKRPRGYTSQVIREQKARGKRVNQ